MSRDQSVGSARRAIVRAALTVALFALVVFAVDQLVPGARHRLARASPGWLAGALAFELLACAAYVLLFQAVFSRIPWFVRPRRGTEIALGEIGAFAITPTGLGGPAVRVWGLRASRMPWRVLVVRSISHAAIFNVPYVVAAAVLGVGVSLRVLPGHAPVLTALAPLALVVGTCALVAAAAWFARGDRVGDGSRWRGWVHSAVATIPDGIVDFAAVARRPQSILGAIGWWAGVTALLCGRHFRPLAGGRRSASWSWHTCWGSSGTPFRCPAAWAESSR